MLSVTSVVSKLMNRRNELGAMYMSHNHVTVISPCDGINGMHKGQGVLEMSCWLLSFNRYFVSRNAILGVIGAF